MKWLLIVMWLSGDISYFVHDDHEECLKSIEYTATLRGADSLKCVPVKHLKSKL